MAGLIQPQVVIDPSTMDAIAGTTPDEVPMKNVCLGCFHTPTGYKSENERHQRLPEAEYKAA